MFKAAIRVNSLKSIAQLRGASLHAQRHDETGQARVREDARAGEGLDWAKGDAPRDYLKAFKAHKAETGAGERKNAPLCLQVLCVVSPDWVEQAGDLHDRNNPRNQQLFDQAKKWAEAWAGEGSVFGARLDLDERGGGVVDLLVSPVRESRGKPVISTNKALSEVKKTTGEKNEYSGLQTSWASWCQLHLDPAIERGVRREITAREHLSPETYGLVREKALEAVTEAPERLLDALVNASLSRKDAERIGDYVFLRGEIDQHKEQGTAYEPPQGRVLMEQAVEALELGNVNEVGKWGLIEDVSSGAKRVTEAAHRFGMDFYENCNNLYENGKPMFPSLSDRMHLSAVVAKCAAFYAHVEAFVKTALGPSGYELTGDQVRPEVASEIMRHERNLGLRIEVPIAKEEEPEHAQQEAKQKPLQRDRRADEHDDDYGDF